MKLVKGYLNTKTQSKMADTLNRKNFNITFLNNVKVLKFSIVGTILMIVTLYFLRFDHEAIRVFFWIWCIINLPAIFLHIEYFVSNAGLKISKDGDKIIIERNNLERTFYVNQITESTIYVSPNYSVKSNYQYLPIENYNFAKINFVDGECIIITCLLEPFVEDILLELGIRNYKKKISLFSSVILS